MGMKLISTMCPECGAALDVEEGRKQIFCTYCGAKVLLHNENEFIIRSIDEAEVKHAETEQMVELKRLEMIEKRNKEKAKNRTKRLKILAVAEALAFIIIAGGFGLGNMSQNPDSAFYMLSLLGMMLAVATPLALSISARNEDEEDIELLGQVKVPSSVSEYEKKNYTAIEAMFKNAGFTNRLEKFEVRAQRNGA